MDSELDTLDQLVSEESQALAFASVCFGMLVSAVLNLFVAGTMDTTAKVVYAAVVVAGVGGTSWFGATWLRVRKRRPKLIARVRSRSSRSIESRSTRDG